MLYNCNMPDSTENPSHYTHALYRHQPFTQLMEGMGVFDRHLRFNDEYMLREQVALFLKMYGDERLALRHACEIVPAFEAGKNYAQECVKNGLAARIAPKIAAKSLIYTGIRGDFETFDGIYESYQSSMESLARPFTNAAKIELREAVRLDTPYHSDRLWAVPTDDPEKIYYAQTLRRLLSRNALSETLYLLRVEEAGLRPASAITRKLRIGRGRKS